MTQELVGLEIGLTGAKAAKAAKGLEQQVDKSTKEMSKDYKRVQRDIDDIGTKGKKSGRSIADGQRLVAKGTKLAGAGFSSLAAGIAASQAKGEDMGTAMIGVGSSLAAAFAGGGPIGLGIAALATGFGLLTRSADEARQAAIRAAQDGVKVLDKILDRSNQVRDALLRARVGDTLSGTGETVGTFFAQSSAETESAQNLRGLKSKRDALGAARSRLSSASAGGENASAAKAEIARLETQILTAERLQPRLEALVDLRKREAREQRESFAALKKSADLDLRISTEADARKRKLLAIEKERVGLAASLTPLFGEQAAMEKAGAVAAKRLRDLAAERVKIGEKELDVRAKIKKETESLHRKEREAARKKEQEFVKLNRMESDTVRRLQREQDLNKAIGREISLLGAATDLERERLRIGHEREDLIGRGANALKVEALSQAKVKAAEADALKALDGRLAKEKAITKEKEKQGGLLQSDGKTKAGFSSITRNSAFGRGTNRAGSGLGDIRAPVLRRSFTSPRVLKQREKRAEKEALEKAAAAAKEAEKAQDGNAKAAEDLGNRIREMNEKIVEVTKASSETDRELVEAMRRAVDELRALKREFEETKKKAGVIGVGPA